MGHVSLLSAAVHISILVRGREIAYFLNFVPAAMRQYIRHVVAIPIYSDEIDPKDF